MFKRIKNDKVDITKLNEVLLLSKNILKIVYFLAIIIVVYLVTIIFKEWNIMNIFFSILSIVSPLFIGFFVAWLFNPFVTYLEEKGMRRGLGTLLTYMLLIGFVYILLGMIISISSNTNRSIITLVDGQAGQYGVYNRDLGYYTYFLPVGKYKIISCKAKEKPAIDLFDAVVWKSDNTSYSLEGKTYRKSASDETIYTTELLDTFTISENEYIYIPLNWTITLEIIK